MTVRGSADTTDGYDGVSFVDVSDMSPCDIIQHHVKHQITSENASVILNVTSWNSDILHHGIARKKKIQKKSIEKLSFDKCI